MRIFLGVLFFANQALAWTLPTSDIQGWQTSQLEVHVNPDGCSVSTAVLYQVIDAALAAWNHIPTANITLSRAAEPSTATVTEFLQGTAKEAPIILCDPNFGANKNGDPDRIPAATRVGQHSTLDYAGILLNSQPGAGDDIANFAASNLNILQLALTHEVGHLLGLGHSGLQSAIMYYSLDGKTNLSISRDDKDGISFLYPRNEFANGAFGCAAVHSSRRPSDSLGWFLAMLCLIAGGAAVANRAHRRSVSKSAQI